MKVLTPIKALRAYCIECSAYNRAEVKRCEMSDCPLWPYRMGHRPTAEERRTFEDATKRPKYPS